MDFTPQTGRTTSGKGRGGYTIESGRTRRKVGNGTASNAATTQTRHEYRGQARQEALPSAKNYARMPKAAISKQKGVPASTRTGKGQQWPAGHQSAPIHNDLIDRMMRDGVHMHKIPARVNLKRGQRLV